MRQQKYTKITYLCNLVRSSKNLIIIMDQKKYIKNTFTHQRKAIKPDRNRRTFPKIEWVATKFATGFSCGIRSLMDRNYGPVW